MSVPVIAIDGPSASGKGTIAKRVAQALRFHYLESGALYRLVALTALRQGLQDEQAIARAAEGMDVVFVDDEILLEDQDVSSQIRHETVGNRASEIAPMPAVRQALLKRQRAFREPPGLVADGRDMATIVFPDAAMTAAVLALFADGPSVIRNVASWRVKETDRLAAMATELRKLGADVEEGKDFLKIKPGKLKSGVAIDTYDDHRMAMSFSLAALGGVAVRINDPQCVAKTVPDYFSVFRSIAN